MLKSVFLAVMIIGPAAAAAQGTVAVDPAYRRAQALVNDGSVAQGRAVVDSMIAAAAPGSNDYAEGVYWRAVLAATAADAEMDYRRIVVDFSASPRVEDALIRLAQLEIARGNYDGAIRHLSRLAVEHPDSPARARAGYWSTRPLFDKNDIQGGCAATADALQRVSDSDAELRNQINYLNQRCAGVVLAPAQSPATETAVAPTSGVPGNPPVTTSATTPAAPPVSIAPAPVNQPAPQPATQPAAPAADSSRVAVQERPVSKPQTPAQTPVPQTRVPQATAPRTTPAAVKPAAENASSAGTKKVWSVQIAAYNLKSQADAMVAKLKRSGYEARVDGTSAPFRVRIGKYATQGQASAVQRSLKAKQMTGFVVQAELQ